MTNRALVIVAALVAAAPALAVPVEITQQGRLLDAAGVPLDGSETVSFTLFDAPAGGAQVWTESLSVAFDQGYYAVVLGETAPLDGSILGGDTLWLALQVGTGAELPTRLPLTSVPYAVHAGTATQVSGGSVDATEIKVNGATIIDSSGALVGPGSLASLSCTADQVATWSGSAWTCGDVGGAHTHDAADITAGTIALARLPVGTGADAIAAGDHAHTLDLLDGAITADQLPSDFDDVVLELLGANDLENPLNHDRYTDEDAVAAATAGLYHSLSGQFIKLYGKEITKSAGSASQVNPHLNITATRSNYIGSASFEMVGANHCNYCYSGGPKAVIWANGNVPFTFYVAGDSVYVDMGTVNSITIRSSYPIEPSVETGLPTGATAVVKMN